MNSQNMRNLAWKVGSLSPELASVRYRAILPIIALNSHGIESSIYDSIINIDVKKFDTVIIVKSFTSDDLILAQQACAQNKKVIFDLCDNIFIKDYRGKQPTTPAEMFMAILPYLSGVTVTTAALKDVIDQITHKKTPCFIVPDGIESNREYTEAKRILFNAAKKGAKKNLINALKSAKKTTQEKTESAIEILKSKKQHFKSDIKNVLRPISWINKLYIAYDIARAKFTGAPRKTIKPLPFFSTDIYLNGKKISKKQIPSSIKRVIWFGNHGAKYAQFGILDLLPLRRALEKAHQECNLELVVISNNRERFLKYIAPFNCFTRYVEWSANAVDSILQTSDACLVPNSKDEFSICKSANRTVMSLNANIPVIATLTPALHELSEAIYWQDPYQGILECLQHPNKAKEKVVLGKKLIKELYGRNAIAKAEAYALQNASTPSVSTPQKAEIIIAIHLIQDYELAQPLIIYFARQKQSYAVWLSASLARKAPRVLHWLTNENIPYLCMQDEISAINPEIFKQFSAKKFVTFAETNLGPHKFTHSLTKLANQNKLDTYTFQHGFENIGITYSDQVHNIHNIEIAASKILTWGTESTLHADIKPEIKNNIIPVGCIKPIYPEVSQPTPLDEETGLIIGIFENLHWHRYSAEYQANFLNALTTSATTFPNIKFFIKPHPAGMWLTSRFKGTLPEHSNIIIAEPTDPKWERPLLADYFRKLSGVISTPSTVILDAARMNLPVLVCGFDLELNKFSPLAIANNIDDWTTFINDIAHQKTEAYINNNTQFIEHVLIDGNAIENAVNLITS